MAVAMESGKPRTILIVDDEALFRRSLAEGLQQHEANWQVLTADNGLVARAILEREPVDLLLTDLAMPESDGFELLAYLAEHRPWIPALVLTAFGTEETGKRLGSLGFEWFLEKPVDLDALVERISAIFESGATGFMRGISLPTFLQILELERKSCQVRVSAGGRTGTLILVGGALHDAEAGPLVGEEAAAEIVCWDGAELEMSAVSETPNRRIRTPLRELMLDSFRRRDENLAGRGGKVPRGGDASSRRASRGAKPIRKERKENEMSIAEKLKELTVIDGFAGAGLYTPAGESLGVLSANSGFTKDIGVLANNVLQNAQRASLEMGTGRGQQVHVQAEKAHILVRCLNEGTDPLKSEPGKAHVHLVLALTSDDAIGLAKMKINSVIEKLASECRA
jgi:CheY-like chemotaxis protein